MKFIALSIPQPKDPNKINFIFIGLIISMILHRKMTLI